MKSEPLPLHQLKTYSLKGRSSLVAKAAFAEAVDPPKGAVAALRRTLPEILGAKALLGLADAIAAAGKIGAPCLWGLGGHVLKVGLTPLLQDLIQRGHVQGIALNGSGTIHDLELAMIGATSEDVQSAITDGSFGMAQETAAFLNAAVSDGARQNLGFGESVGRAIANSDLPHKELSLLAFAFEHQVPVTVHVTVGADIVHMHPSADGAAIGQTSLQDFRRFTQLVTGLEGGVYLNWGSAVTLPEVFLKAVSTARNLGFALQQFSTANLDQIAHYRPRVNVLQRPRWSGL